MQASEVRALKLAKMGLVLVYEFDSHRALHGKAAGVADAKTAQAQLNALGLKTAPVYFAVDFDATPGDQAAINQYLMGAASVLGWQRVGVYGSYWVVSRALAAKVCKYGWETYAWSGTNVDSKAHLFQYKNGQRVGGVSVDLDRALQADFGDALAAPAPAPKPVPKPKPVPPPPPAPKPVPPLKPAKPGKPLVRPVAPKKRLPSRAQVLAMLGEIGLWARGK